MYIVYMYTGQVPTPYPDNKSVHSDQKQKISHYLRFTRKPSSKNDRRILTIVTYINNIRISLEIHEPR